MQSNRAAAKAVQGRVEVGWLPHNLRKQQVPLNVTASLTIENLVSYGNPWMSLDSDRFPFESIGMHAIHDYSSWISMGSIIRYRWISDTFHVYLWSSIHFF